VKRGELWAKDMGKSELLLGKPLGNIWEHKKIIYSTTDSCGNSSFPPRTVKLVLVMVLLYSQELSVWILRTRIEIGKHSKNLHNFCTIATSNKFTSSS
jgi:hypothetical protein